MANKTQNNLIFPEYLTEKQNKFLANLTATGYHVDKALKMTGVTQKEYREWLSTNTQLATIVSNGLNVFFDEALSKLKEALPEAIDVVLSLARESEDPRIKLEAAKVLLDRAFQWGRLEEFKKMLLELQTNKRIKPTII